MMVEFILQMAANYFNVFLSLNCLSVGRLARFFSSLRRKKLSPAPPEETVSGSENEVIDNMSELLECCCKKILEMN